MHSYFMTPFVELVDLYEARAVGLNTVIGNFSTLVPDLEAVLANIGTLECAAKSLKDWTLSWEVALIYE
jgi:hypothetical protein